MKDIQTETKPIQTAARENGCVITGYFDLTSCRMEERYAHHHITEATAQINNFGGI